MLVDSPADDVFLQVGEELVRRLRWAEAEQVLVDGLAHLPADDERRAGGFGLLARASLETGRYDLTASALKEVDRDPVRNPELARIEVLWLERSGQLDAARERAQRFLELDPHDVVAQAAIERMSAPPPSPAARALDPFYTVARAERYVEIGRSDRAIRVLRRILRASLGEPELAQRIEQRLRQITADVSGLADDLSEELTDPGLVPEHPDPTQEDVVPQLAPRLVVPVPHAGPHAGPHAVPSSPPTAPAPPSRPPVAAVPAADPVPRADFGELGGPDLEDDEPTQTTEEAPFPLEDEITDLHAAAATASTAPTSVPASTDNARERRRRRSLLRR